MKNLGFLPYLARQLSAHEGVNPYGFTCSARWNLNLRTRRLRTSAWNTENTASLYWFGPSESKTLRPIVGVDCLRIAYGYKGRLARLILGMRSVTILLVGYDLET
jgi:hypothetical protein